MEFDPLTLNTSERIKKKFASSLNRRNPQNDLWAKIFKPSLIIPDMGIFTCLAVHRESNHSHQSVLRLLEAHEDDIAHDGLAQHDIQFFTNPFRFPRFGPDRDRWTREYSKSWQPPSQRTGVGYHWVFTLEHDPDDVDGIEIQFDWFTIKDVEGSTLLDRVDAEFRKFTDYRGHSVVWSGHKSFHIHFVFDTTNLSLAALKSWCASNGKATEARLRDHYQGSDLSDHALTGYYSERWVKIVEIAQTVMGDTIEFDSKMAQLHQKRRLPWGMRKAEDGNLLGIPAGTLIPQIVVAEKIISTSPRGSSGTFLTAKDGNEFIKEPTRERSNARTSGTRPVDNTDNQEQLLERLQTYLAEQWGRSFPKPWSIEGDVGNLTVRFTNHETDNNPSTVCVSPNARLLPGGKGALQTGSPDLRLPQGQTIDDIVGSIQEELAGAGLYSSPRGAPGSIFGERGTLDQRILAAQPRTKQGARDGLATITEMALNQCDHNVFVSAEGVGKSFNLAHEAIRRRVEAPGRRRLGADSGFNVFACLSYQQAESLCGEWATNRDGQWPGQGDAQAVLLLSFSERYRRHCSRNEVKPITEGQAARQGYDSQIEAVYDLHWDAYDAITQEKNEAWMVTTDRKTVSAFHSRVATMVFTTHSMAQGFNQISKAKAWLHPEFEFQDHVAGRNRDYEDLANEFRAFQIIHDEIAPEDIAMIVSEADFEFTEKVRLSTQPDWDHAKLPEKYRAYTSVAHAQSEALKSDRGLSFGDTRGIIDARFTTDDIVTVDYDAIPYGRDRTENGIYRSQSGRNWYVRKKDWWTKQEARISVTTTERLPSMMLAAMSDTTSAEDDGCTGKAHFRVWRWDDDEVFAFRSVPVIRTPDASGQTSPDDQQKSKVEVLVANVLGEDGPDMVITDRVQHQSVVNHATARGRNDMADLNLATVIMHLAPEHYSLLNVIAQKFNLVDHHPDVVRLHYRDQINQALGRNQGFRRDEANPKEHVVHINQNLYNWLGADFFRDGRYPMHLVKA